MTRLGFSRFAGLVLSASALLGTTAASAIDDAVLTALYGEGMKSFYNGNFVQAHETFTQAIDAGSKDPRCFYFRGLSNARLGRAPDAKLDFTRGAELEGQDFDVFYNVSGALQRVQGAERLALERYRAEGRKHALKEIEKIRFQHYQRFAEAQAVAGPATTGAGAGTGAAAAPGADGATPAAPATPAADNPFGTPAPAANPFGAPAAPAPAAPAAPAPAANPFGN